MKKIFFTVAILFSLFVLTGCGSDLSKYAGTYKLEYSKFVGDPESAKDTSKVAEMILNADGTGKSNRDDLNLDVEWSISGENITLTEKFLGAKIEYNGTLKDGKLDLFNGDKNDDLTNETFYVKQ